MVNTRIIFTVLILILCLAARAQSPEGFHTADAIARSAPDDPETTLQELSAYFALNLSSKTDLVRAFYWWTANRIGYDAENMFSLRPVEDTARLISETLRNRKAVCIGYAALFHELCRNAGIESYIILGYTRQQGVVVNTNHAWILVHTDTCWNFTDPTWGAGFIQNGSFEKKFTDIYFSVQPDVMIKSHLPFDPLWQCLYQPISPSDFISGNSTRKRDEDRFEFPDSIAIFNNQSKIEKLENSIRRIEKNGVADKVLRDFLDYLRKNLEAERINQESIRQNGLIRQFNQAVADYNEGASLFNDYINYWNRQFQPERPDQEIKQMLDACSQRFRESSRILGTLNNAGDALKQNISQLKEGIRVMQKRVDEQYSFLREYTGTQKQFRSALFRK